MDDTVKILNKLIETSEDGLKGFNEAAERATEPQLKQVFADRAQSCSQSVRELQTLVTALGGEPETSGSVAGAAHRGWVKVKTAVSDNNIAVLEEVERGEDHAKASYTKALKSELPPQVRQVVEKQFQGVVANHDRIRDLRNQYRAAA
ncbi:PA2169 family four-helix-bundle protein [Hydrocarboniphaga sp.]|uniref:PA2169 family four-helix-bundle protein n=1 Tax=Hydrocarboniphaga sp. TaxID=2033016 RepID=UPI003D0E96C9